MKDVHGPEVPDTALRPMSAFSSVGDGPVIEPKQDILTPGTIRRHNLTPCDVVDLLQGGDVMRLRKSLRAVAPLLLLAFAAPLLVLFLVLRNPDLIFPGVFAVLIVWAMLLSVALHTKYNAMYEVGWDLISSTYGKLSGVQRTLTLTAKQLRSTEVKQNIFQKLVGVGDIGVSDMVPDQKDISMEGLDQPYFYAEVVRELNRRHQLIDEG